jgi:hypothetical protein
MRVLPKQDGTCPSCQYIIRRKKPTSNLLGDKLVTKSKKISNSIRKTSASSVKMDSQKKQISRAMYEHAASLVEAGESKAKVVADLKSRGFDEESANIAANNIFNRRAIAVKEAGKKNMLYGALWCIGGVVVTALSYLFATSSPTGGRYIITYGAIVIGAIQFIRGFIQFTDV